MQRITRADRFAFFSNANALEAVHGRCLRHTLAPSHKRPCAPVLQPTLLPSILLLTGQLKACTSAPSPTGPRSGISQLLLLLVAGFHRCICMHGISCVTSALAPLSVSEFITTASRAASGEDPLGQCGGYGRRKCGGRAVAAGGTGSGADSAAVQGEGGTNPTASSGGWQAGLGRPAMLGLAAGASPETYRTTALQPQPQCPGNAAARVTAAAGPSSALTAALAPAQQRPAWPPSWPGRSSRSCRATRSLTGTSPHGKCAAPQPPPSPARASG